MSFAPLVVAVLAGIAVGWFNGGHLSELRRLQINSPLLVAAVIGSGLAIDHYDIAVAPLVAVIGIVAGVGFAFRNIHLAGMVVVGIGIFANLLPVVLNGAVPVRADALVDAEMIEEADIAGLSINGSRELTGDSTILAVLGDTIPVRLTSQVMSYGDLILLVGLADVIANGMRRRKRRARSRSGQSALIARGSPDQLWGIAPKPTPESPTQYSAMPDSAAPATVPVRTTEAMSDSPLIPDFDVATQSR